MFFLAERRENIYPEKDENTSQRKRGLKNLNGLIVKYLHKKQNG